MNSENLENQGEITGQDNGKDWQEQAKYFQSEKDKLFEENKVLKKYEKLGEVLEARPDIIKDIKKKLTGNPNQVELKKPENFDPWEAYNDPKSESYKYRHAEMENSINSKVQKQVAQSTAHLEEEQVLSKLTDELRIRGMNKEQIDDFIDFTDTNPSDYGLDNIIKMYYAYKGNDQVAPSQIDKIKQTQNSPTVGGILNGEMPETPSDEDDRWKNVLGASRVGNKIP